MAPAPFRIGGFHVCCFHHCTHAPSIHVELKRQHLDVAVVDHAFILSPLQLAAAFFRMESNPEWAATPRLSSDTAAHHHTSTDAQTFAPSPSSRRLSHSRRIFASLSLSHNLDRILQVLPPGPQTSSVVLIYKCPSADGAVAPISSATAGPSVWEAGTAMQTAIAQCVHTTNPTAEPHAFLPIGEPFWRSEALRHVDMQKAMRFYGVSETTLSAARHSLTRRELRRVCAAAATDNAEVQTQALQWYALELCVITSLAACTA